MASQEEIWSQLGEVKIITNNEIGNALRNYNRMYSKPYKEKSLHVGKAYYIKMITNDGLNLYSRIHEVTYGYKKETIITNHEIVPENDDDIIAEANFNFNYLKVTEATGAFAPVSYDDPEPIRGIFNIDGLGIIANEEGFEELGQKYKSDPVVIKEKIKTCLDLLGLDSEKYISEFEAKASKNIDEKKKAEEKMEKQKNENPTEEQEEIRESRTRRTYRRKTFEEILENLEQEIKEMQEHKNPTEKQEFQVEKPIEEVIENLEQENRENSTEKEDEKYVYIYNSKFGNNMIISDKKIRQTEQEEELKQLDYSEKSLKETTDAQQNKIYSQEYATDFFKKAKLYTNVPSAVPIKKKWREIITEKIKELAQKGKDTIENLFDR